MALAIEAFYLMFTAACLAPKTDLEFTYQEGSIPRTVDKSRQKKQETRSYR